MGPCVDGRWPVFHPFTLSLGLSPLAPVLRGEGNPCALPAKNQMIWQIRATLRRRNGGPQPFTAGKRVQPASRISVNWGENTGRERSIHPMKSP